MVTSMNRAFRRWSVGSVLLVAAIVSGVRWGPVGWRHVQLYLAQRQCMAYVAPQKQVIYSSDPATDPFVRIEANASTPPPPKCWALFEAGLTQPVSMPKDSVLGLDGPLDPLTPAPAFIHRRDAKNGKQRLVVVQFGGQILGGKMNRVLCFRVIAPATLFHAPVVLSERSEIIISNFEWEAAVQVYAGSADESDPSRFTVDLDVDEKAKRIDGWLQDDDTVKMVMRERSEKKQ